MILHARLEATEMHPPNPIAKPGFPPLSRCLCLSEQDLPRYSGQPHVRFLSSLMPLMSHAPPSQMAPPASSMSKPVGFFLSRRESSALRRVRYPIDNRKSARVLAPEARKYDPFEVEYRYLFFSIRSIVRPKLNPEEIQGERDVSDYFFLQV